MSQISTIFFDWGGVIADDPGNDFLRSLLANIGATKQQMDEIHDTYMRRFMCGHISESEYWDQLRTNYGFRIHDSISDEFLRWHGLRTNPAILALVDELQAAGYATAVLSNVIEPTYRVLEASGHYDRFETVIASYKVGFAKPDIEIYHLALDALHTTANQSLFIDDKPHNLEPAAAMGFRTILAQNPDQIIRDIRSSL